MRGKLRDKRVNGKRDGVSREVAERRRPYKRDARTMQTFQQPDEDDLEFELDSDVLNDKEIEEVEIKPAIPTQK